MYVLHSRRLFGGDKRLLGLDKDLQPNREDSSKISDGSSQVLILLADMLAARAHVGRLHFRIEPTKDMSLGAAWLYAGGLNEHGQLGYVQKKCLLPQTSPHRSHSGRIHEKRPSRTDTEEELQLVDLVRWPTPP